MISIGRTTAGMVALALVLGAGARAAADEKAPPKEAKTVEIGMPKSLFQGYNETFIRIGAGPFLKLMKDSTAVDGKLTIAADAMSLASQINEGKVQLGVFLGHEFAWAKKKHPDLIPIAVADPMQPAQAFCLVIWNSKAKTVGDLKNESISLPPVLREYCDLYLTKQKEAHMKGASFKAQVKATTAEDAIFDVIEGRSGLTIVDAAALKGFRTLHPGQFANLKILCQSEVFPNACVAVRNGEMDAKTVDKFREALLRAPSLPNGKPMLSTWKLNGFKKVPDDYDKQLKDIEKLYPLPPALRAAIDK